MGQYYTAAIKEENGSIVAYDMQVKFDGNDFRNYNGIKLMEHSWWENDFCNAFAHKLLNHKARVVWCGDYAEPDELKNVGFPEETYNLGETRIEPIENWSLNDVKFLVNHDKKLFINLKLYFDKSLKDNEVIFPISLLTAVGNGRGCGDYHEENVNYEYTGTWAGDLIELSDDISDDYNEMDIYFKED